MKCINDMSRVGVWPIEITSAVTFMFSAGKVTVKGPKGELSLELHPTMTVEQKDNQLLVRPKDESVKNSALWGTSRMLIANMVKGVTEGYEKKLELNGTGYKSSVSGKKLVLELGYSHPVEVVAPEGIQFAAEKNVITVSGIDKQLVGEISAQIRSKRKVEPYKGKGIRYAGEFVRRKVGKRAAGEGDK